MSAGIQGTRAFLRKPVARHELLAAVDEITREIQRVLIVDNDPAVARLFRRMLAGRVPPRACLEALDGAEALRSMRAMKPDLVVLDLMMPTLDGYSVLKQMAQDPELADIPVILASAVGIDGHDLRLMGSIQIVQPRGFELGEVLQILQSTLDILSPGWSQSQSNGPALRAALPV